MAIPDAKRFEPSAISDWHDWLSVNYQRHDGVWVVQWRTSAGRPVIPYEELVREALCWGWIDGQVKLVDELRAGQWMAPRRTNSGWAASNKARVAELEREGRLQPPGIAEIERAKLSGMWTIYDTVEALEEPTELAAALDAVPAARKAWDTFPPSVRKQALTAIALAKRPRTRANRIAAIVEKSASGIRPA